MTDSAAAERDSMAATIEQMLVTGDLAKLTAEQRVVHYRNVCQSLGLNPLTKPFDYLNLNGKLILYAKKDATDQLRALRGISVNRLEREEVRDIYTVTAYGVDANGRHDSAIGAVSIKSLAGVELANAFMRAESKAKRRLTLSLAGLGWLDEVEVDSTPGVRADVDQETGEIRRPAPRNLTEVVQRRREETQPVSDAPSDAGNAFADTLVGNAEAAGKPGPATAEQRAALMELCRGITTQQLAAVTQRLWGFTAAREITEGQAAALLEAGEVLGPEAFRARFAELVRLA